MWAALTRSTVNSTKARTFTNKFSVAAIAVPPFFGKEKAISGKKTRFYFEKLIKIACQIEKNVVQ